MEIDLKSLCEGLENTLKLAGRKEKIKFVAGRRTDLGNGQYLHNTWYSQIFVDDKCVYLTTVDFKDDWELAEKQANAMLISLIFNYGVINNFDTCLI